MGKLGEVNGYVRITLDKLEGIRSDLVRTDDSWQEWKFPHLIEALRKWTERNPPNPDEREGKAHQNLESQEAFKRRRKRYIQDHAFIVTTVNTNL